MNFFDNFFCFWFSYPFCFGFSNVNSIDFTNLFDKNCKKIDITQLNQKRIHGYIINQSFYYFNDEIT
jgi:hypothetical protein